ncbi:sialin-like isoform X1 [Ornithodoros turicata]|uniref:sialin-like isoform X1 n=1 Tax=Ornithodoros turicata TaxID=34597 RepID=UPI003139C05E
MILSAKCCLPYRYIITALIALGCFFACAHRTNFNLVVVAVVPRPSAHPSGSQERCNASAEAPGVRHNFRNQSAAFQWSETEQDVMLSAFFWGYTIPQTFAGLAADKATPKHMLSIGVVIPGLLSFLTPMAAYWHWGAVVLLRTLMGFAQAFVTASEYALIANWAPKFERARMLSICFIGYSIGAIVTMPVTGLLIQYDVLGGWPSTFYIFGAMSIGWFMMWSLLASNTPDETTCVWDGENKYSHLASSADTAPQAVEFPWKSVLTSGPVWGVVAAKTGSTFGLSAFQTKIPAYMDRILCMSIERNAAVNGMIFTALSLGSLLWASVADELQRRRILDTTTIRKMFAVICFCGSATCLVALSHLSQDKTSASVFLMLFMVMFSGQSGAHLPNIVDISPQFSGTIFGIANTFGSAGALASPLVASFFLWDADDPLRWSYYFYACSGVILLSGLTYIALCSSELQEWAKAPREERRHVKTKYGATTETA